MIALVETAMKATRTLGTFPLVLLAATAAVAAVEPADRRDRVAAPEARRPTAPGAPRAPRELVGERPASKRDTAIAQASGAPSPRRPPDGSVDRAPGEAVPTPAEIDVAGYAAGRWTAAELVRSEGRLAAYRVGFWEGQRVAFADPEVGVWERNRGRLAGERDRASWETGRREGERQAYDRAAAAASDQVARQFSILSWQPVRSPVVDRSSFDGTFPPTPAPELETIFRTRPPLDTRMARSFQRGDWSPWRLHGAGSWNEFYDREWKDAARGLRTWIAEPARSSYWRLLGLPEMRAYFEAAFAEGYWDEIEAHAGPALDEAYGEGFDDGWRYGADVKGTWSWEAGRAEGMDAALRMGAQEGYARAYAAAYLEAYHRTFDEWLSTSRPRILDAQLRDGNDDGVFQPGERLEVDWLAANFGGEPGRHAVRVSGNLIGSGEEVVVDLPGRARVPGEGPFVLTIDPHAPAPTEATVVVAVEESTVTLPFRVAFPVEFTGEVEYRSLPLERRASVAFGIENRSRKPVEGIEVVLGAGTRRLVGRLAPGESANVAFDLHGVRPLDLLSGAFEVEARAIVAGAHWDGRVARFPELATDLRNPALVDYLVALGRDRDADPAEVAATRRLLAQRIAADWDVARRGDGNPYKDDAQDAGTRTALGELVNAYARDRATLSRSIAFHGLGDEIAAQVEELPGANPLLRRWARKLAGKLA